MKTLPQLVNVCMRTMSLGLVLRLSAYLRRHPSVDGMAKVWCSISSAL